MSPDAVTVNLDAWNALTDEERAAIERVADEMETGFWEVSAAEDATETQVLVDNGMTVSEADESLTAAMAEAGKAMWAEFFETVPEAQAVVEDYAARVGK